jgi:hypothetical protein
MSKQEFSRLDVLLRVQSGRPGVSDARALIGLQRRQVFRLLHGLKQDGPGNLLSKRRGKPSNHRLPAEVRILASIVRERYADFGPTLAAEKLAEHHGCSVSRETSRGWMIADGRWQDRRHRLPVPHQPRRRRDYLGELAQIDGSEHAWFEDRGPPCTLLAFVDDATSRLMRRQFVASESAFDYFRSTRAYLEEHGKPVAFYSDKHGIFRVNSKDAVPWPPRARCCACRLPQGVGSHRCASDRGSCWVRRNERSRSAGCSVRLPRSGGAAAAVDRRLAEAEFRSYIRASGYCQYGNTRNYNKQSLNRMNRLLVPPLLAP